MKSTLCVIKNSDCTHCYGSELARDGSNRLPGSKPSFQKPNVENRDGDAFNADTRLQHCVEHMTSIELSGMKQEFRHAILIVSTGACLWISYKTLPRGMRKSLAALKPMLVLQPLRRPSLIIRVIVNILRSSAQPSSALTRASAQDNSFCRYGCDISPQSLLSLELSCLWLPTHIFLPNKAQAVKELEREVRNRAETQAIVQRKSCRSGKQGDWYIYQRSFL